MNREAVLYGVIGLLLGVILTFGLTGYQQRSSMDQMMRGMGIYENQKRDNDQGESRMSNMDRHFIEQMIPHHEDAITMAEIALEKAQHQEIKNLASGIKRTQSAEIEQMRDWYREWFGREVPEDRNGRNGTMGQGMSSGTMHGGMMGDATDVRSLSNASDFDQAFIEQMIPHHQMAVMMANMLLASTDRPEMKKLAEDIITAQTKEIENMRSWAKTWGYAPSFSSPPMGQ